MLLSIGYAACHWCHVMAHESFEDEATAALMNELFVCVKVDREERPDVDAVYMEAVQAMTGHGGWPMTVFLTPDGRPFYGGTYFPNKPRHGMPAFEQVLRAVDEAWRDERDRGRRAGGPAHRRPRPHVRPARPDRRRRPRPTAPPSLTRARDALARRFDTHWGGFGPAPKFPQPDTLELLLRAHARHPDDAEALAMVVTTLDAMASGGMYDHLGGGFARYSIDGRWLVPHFEKMLYDQALLVRAYLHAWQVTGEDRFLQVLTETIDYVRRDLRHPDGGFYSSEDADSEGHEGTFYVWTVDELRDAAGRRRRRRHRVVGREPARQLRGQEHPPPAGAGRPAAAGGDRAGPPHTVRRPGEAGPARPRRQGARPSGTGCSCRPWPRPAAATGREDWLADAKTNGEFLLHKLRRSEDGRWLRSWQGGRPGRHLALAADYAALVDGFTRLAEATGEAQWVAWAQDTADAMLRLFWDDEAGGLFTTGADAEQPHHPVEGPGRQRRPVGQRHRRRRPPPPGRPHRRRRATGSGPRPSSACWPRWPSSTRRPSPARWRPSTWRRSRSPRWPSSATAPTWCGRCSPGTCPTRSWPGASPTRRPCSRPARRRGPGLRVRELRLPGPGRHGRGAAGPTVLTPCGRTTTVPAYETIRASRVSLSGPETPAQRRLSLRRDDLCAESVVTRVGPPAAATPGGLRWAGCPGRWTRAGPADATWATAAGVRIGRRRRARRSPDWRTS